MRLEELSSIMSKNTKNTDNGPQADRFRAMAEELECDPDEAAFRSKLAVIAKAKVEDAPKHLKTQPKR